MQTISPTFLANSQADVRQLSWNLRMSFAKTFDPAVTFFTLDTSVLDGPDILSPTDNNVIAEWDKYDYADYSDRVIQMEWSREEDVPYSVSQAIADVTLNNYDNYFTRGGSPLDPNLLPRRPIRLLSGFRGVTIPQFVGLTETVPRVDKSSRTANVHCIDFLSFLFNKPLDQTVMLEDKRTDEVLDYLFQLFGLSSGQYVLDEGFNTIAFVYWEKGKKLGDAIRELMQAELGSLYMDELGIIRFRNRLKSSTSAVATFDNSNIIDYQISDETKIINVVEVKSDVREVQPLQVVYSSVEPLLVTAGQTAEFFFNFEDPVTTIDTIDSYVANSLETGGGVDLTSDIDVDSATLFTTAVKVVFENTGGTDAYITEINILGTPARVVRQVYLRAQDDDSVEAFEEQPLIIDNNLIQDNSGAESIALSLIGYYKDYANTIEIEVKGNPALQLGDNIDVNVDDLEETYTITKITNILENSGRYIQRIIGKVFNIPSFFILSSDDTPMSLLDGPDVLSP